MKKNYLLILAAFIFVTGHVNAQAPVWLWANRTGVIYDHAMSNAVDASGNVYVTGLFNGTVDFDPGPGTLNLTSAGGFDIFVTRSDASGNLTWAKRMGGTSDEGGAAMYIDTAGGGAVYTTGWFHDTADFNPGAGVSNLISAGGRDIFISKLNAAGNFVWAKRIGGTTTYDEVFSITADPSGSGSCYISGRFSGTSDFDPGAATYNLTTVGWTDIFICKLDGSGNLAWAHRIGGSSNDGALSITTDASGNVYTSGYFGDTVDFDPGVATFNLNFAGGTFTNIFVLKLNSAGNFVWAKSMGGMSGYGNGNSIAVDAAGNVYVAGMFSATADFDPGTGTFGIASAGGEDIFILKLNGSGNFIWAKSMGGTDNDQAYSIIPDPAGSGDVYTSGHFKATADFNPGAGTFNLTSAGGMDMFLSKLDGSGNFKWAKSMGGIKDDYFKSIALDYSGHLYAAGYFYSPSISFDAVTLTNWDDDGATTDIFNARLDTQGAPPSASITAGGPTVLCYPGSVTLNANTGTGLSYQWRLNNVNIAGANAAFYTATATGNYDCIVSNAFGSSASNIITVTVNSLPNATITAGGPATFCSGGSVTLNAVVAANRTYQWKKNGANIPGANLSGYTATTGGTYKVRVTNTVTGCSKTTVAGTMVTVNSKPAATITPQGPTTFCAGGSVVLAANTGTGLTYKWKKNNNIISGATLSNYTATTAGTYRVEVTNSNGCSKLSAGVTVTVPCKLSESESESEFEVKVFPNPNSGEFTIKFSNKPSSPLLIELTDELGKVMKKFETANESVLIKELNLSKGIYFLKVQNNEEVVIRKINIVR